MTTAAVVPAATVKRAVALAVTSCMTSVWSIIADATRPKPAVAQSSSLIYEL